MLLGFLLLRGPFPVAAQEWADLDAIFDEIPGDEMVDDPGGLAEPISKPGFSLDLSYSANLGFSPGWTEAPWFMADHNPVYSHVIGANLNSYIGLDVRISEALRASSSLALSVPWGVALKEFFVDYNLASRVFFRAGKFSQNWGISPNFPAANLLSRLPAGNPGGDPYILKADIPIGIGGLQLIALTRSDSMQSFGYGGKYNLAFTWADIDMGLFYHEDMPLRGSVSVKTTVKDTELYLEALGAVQTGTWDDPGFSANLGFVRNFFGSLLTVNGEIFWNGEGDASYFTPKTELDDAPPASSFIPGLNMALNLVVRPPWKGNFRFALASRWAVGVPAAGGPAAGVPASETNTAYIVPGLSFSPLRHIEVSLGFPLALGGREGRYYRSNADIDNRPFGIALLVNLSGSYRLEKH